MNSVAVKENRLKQGGRFDSNLFSTHLASQTANDEDQEFNRSTNLPSPEYGPKDPC